MTDGEKRRMTMRDILSNHYRAERDRSERCIGDIIDALGDRDNTDSQTVQAILDRIIQHYDRR